MISTQVPSANNDAYCIKAQGSQCIECANGYFLNSTGTCNQLNPLCKSSNMTTGFCTDCYQGYVLAATTCIVAASVNIPYCKTVLGNVCDECISGYFVKSGGCELVNVLCATYDPKSGVCFSCIPGYVFQRGECILPSLGIDPFCTEYSNSYCTTCMKGYALVNYICTGIDPNCTNFDNIRNSCLSCANNKVPQGPLCV